MSLHKNKTKCRSRHESRTQCSRHKNNNANVTVQKQNPMSRHKSKTQCHGTKTKPNVTAEKQYTMSRHKNKTQCHGTRTTPTCHGKKNLITTRTPTVTIQRHCHDMKTTSAVTIYLLNRSLGSGGSLTSVRYSQWTRFGFKALVHGYAERKQQLLHQTS